MSSLDHDRLLHDGSPPRPVGAGDPVSTSAPAPRPRPTPHKRTPEPAVAAVVDAQTVRDTEDAVALAAAAEAQSRAVVQGLATAGPGSPGPGPADAVRGGNRLVRRLPAVLRRRPVLLLAAALVTAIGIGAVYAGPAAQARGADRPHSISVAAQLGIPPQQTLAAPDADDTDRLAELAASRATREAEQFAAVQAQQQADAAAAAAIAEAQRPKDVLPVQGARLTSTFGDRWGTLHAGIDLAAPFGTPEYAAEDGVVLEAGPASGFGLAVYIQHANGDVTVYGHMEQVLVQAGQVVKAGDEIALVGSRGQSTGPHLHFEVRSGGINGQKVDPIAWLRERGVSVP